MAPPPASLTAPSSPYLPLNSLFVTACRRTIVVLHLRRERWPPSAARRLRRGWGSNREEGGGDKGGIKGRGEENREGRKDKRKEERRKVKRKQREGRKEGKGERGTRRENKGGK